MGCCDDPTEAEKVSRVDVARAQEQYGALLRDLFVEDPERLMLKQLNYANTYIRELAAKQAHFESVRVQAINHLEGESMAILKTIADNEALETVKVAAVQRIKQLTD